MAANEDIKQEAEALTLKLLKLAGEFASVEQIGVVLSVISAAMEAQTIAARAQIELDQE